MSSSQKVLSLEIPTFSNETDWNSSKTKQELSKAISSIGFCYWKMNDKDRKLYNKALPKIESFFDATLKRRDNSHLPDLNEYQSNFLNYGYADRSKTLKPLQVKAFIIPFQKPSFMSHPSNPWKNDPDIENLGNNLVSHCQEFFYQTLRSYLSTNFGGSNYVKIDESTLKKHVNTVMGENPCKHLRFNYYNPSAMITDDAFGGTHEHYDYGNITFLITSTDGLQVFYNQKWWNIPHYHDRFVINFGKALEITTNGKCKAALHRVPVIKNKKRLSVALFYNPDLEGNLYQYDNNGNLKVLKTFKEHFFGDMFGNPYQQKLRSKY